MFGKPKKKNDQPKINSFFQSKKTILKEKENLFVKQPSATEPSRPSSIKPSLHQADNLLSAKTTSFSENRSNAANHATWWATPPRGNMALPGARKRSSTEAISPSRTPPASRKISSNGGSAPWQGKVKPLVRPQGMASSKQQSQPSIVNALLSDEQKHVLELIVDKGESVFFTGAAGTGKSHVLRQVVSSLKRGKYDAEVSITATTGLAAFNVGGKTIHRWAGIRTGEESALTISQNIKKNAESRENWRRCRVLVIDEVSMLDAKLFDKLEEIARLVRGKSDPFGGIQVVMTGDFFQLPPVSKGSQGDTPLCFEAKCWPAVIKHQIVLSKVFRQKDDRLVQMLNAMRKGQMPDHIIRQFEALDRTVKYDDGLEPTELYPVRWQVDRANAMRLKALEGAVFAFDARDSSTFDSTQKLFDQLLATKRLELKVGAQVLLIRNLNDVLVNGRRGHIVTFMNEREWILLGPFLKDNRKALDVYNVHLNSAAADDTDRAQDRAILEAELDEVVFPDEGVRGHYLQALASPIRSKLPVVDFRQGQVVLIDRVEFSTDSGGGKRPQVVREQLPLVPSWALSIHKSQGQTLDRVVVDLTQVFEAGQAYVAVSRATSYDRLQIKGFKKEKVRVHPRVSRFYNEIERSNANTGLEEDLFIS